ncbi:hypothetical protein Tsp_08135 [Trichinella spiralis]|nr:hypothetical protein Tsp_08135 [Trichinella spiralis]
MNHKAINKKYMKICSVVRQTVAVRNQGAIARCYIQHYFIKLILLYLDTEELKMKEDIQKTRWLSAFERFHVPCLVELSLGFICGK